MNDPPEIKNNKGRSIKSNLIIFADDTSITVANHNSIGFIKDINLTLSDANAWFNANLLSLNLDKTKFIQLVNKNSSCIDMNVGCDDNQYFQHKISMNND
jgi:hypothetical protein